MADLKISELRPLTDTQVAAADLLAVADVSASETRKITAVDQAKATVRLVPDGTIPFDKIDPSTFSLPDGSIETNDLAEDAVTNDKLAVDAVDTPNIVDGAVTGPKIATGAVGTDKLANDAVTADKLASNAVLNDNVVDGAITASKIDPNAFDRGIDKDTGRIGITNTVVAGTHLGISHNTQGLITGVTEIPDGSIETDDLADDAVTNEKLAQNAVDTLNIVDGAVTGAKIDPAAFNRGIDSTANQIGITNSVTPGAHAGISYDEQGLITGTTDLVPVADLPLATTTTAGIVSVPPDGGLAVAGTGAVSIGNSIGPATKAKITYDRHGLVVGGADLEAGDIPLATETTIGGVNVPLDGNLQVNAGAIRMRGSGVTPGVDYTKFACNEFGVVTAASTLEAADVPPLSADKIISGQFDSNRIADGSITGPKIDDYATCLMQEDFPGAGDFLGQFWYTPSTAQLRVYSRGSGPQNIWLPVGFGLLQQQNLRFAFTFDATTSTITSITQYGAPLGLAVGDPIPVATDVNAGAYGVCVVAGTGITLHDVNGANFTIGDWILSAGEVAGWQHINTVDGGGGGGGAMFLNDLLDVTVPTPAQPLQDGQILKYDGNVGQWVNVPDTSTVAIGSTPPSNAQNGALWWDVDSGRLFVWYEEASGSEQTSQWVPATPESGLTGSGESPVQTLNFLNDLDDVEADKIDGVLLRYNSANLRWESSSLIDSGTFAGTFNAVAPPTPVDVVEPKNLNDLNDVNATNTDKAFLQYDAGTSTWISQLIFDGGTFPIVFVAEDYVAPSIVGTTTIENLNDFLDVEVQEVDEAYLVYNDNLNRWEETTIINGGTF